MSRRLMVFMGITALLFISGIYISLMQPEFIFPRPTRYDAVILEHLRQRMRTYGLVGEPVNEEFILTTMGAYNAWLNGNEGMRYRNNLVVYIYHVQGDFPQLTIPDWGYPPSSAKSLTLVIDPQTGIEVGPFGAYTEYDLMRDFDTLPRYHEVATLVLVTPPLYPLPTMIVPIEVTADVTPAE